MAKFLFASSQKCDSPLEVTRFEFTIKSCRCTKTCEGVGTSDFCKAEIAPLPYINVLIKNDNNINFCRGEQLARRLTKLSAGLVIFNITLFAVKINGVDLC